MKYGVQASPLSDTIYVGRLSKKADAFLDKEAATDMTLAAVAQHVAQAFEGAMEATFPRLGLRMIVTVVPMSPPPAPPAATQETQP